MKQNNRTGGFLYAKRHYSGRNIKGGSKMKLLDLLKVIGHGDYSVSVQTNFLFPPIAIEKDKLKDYLDYPVFFISENWAIVLKGEKIV